MASKNSRFSRQSFRTLTNSSKKILRENFASISCRARVPIFLSAALIFAVQPMFTKLVLPRLGGSPSVWSVAMVFFQAALLAGYAYAHLITHYLPGRISIAVHLAVLLLALVSMAVLGLLSISRRKERQAR